MIYDTITLIFIQATQLFAQTTKLFDQGTPVDIPRVDPTPTKVQDIIAYVFTVMGGVAVVMITIGGLKYAMSMGNPQATAKAKDTILYAFIGLLVAVGGIVIIKYVVNNV